jgi:hypothetical protein
MRLRKNEPRESAVRIAVVEDKTLAAPDTHHFDAEDLRGVKSTN